MIDIQEQEVKEVLDNASQEDSEQLSSISDPETIKNENLKEMEERHERHERNVFHDEQSEEHSTLFDSFQFLINTAIGSGTLLVPYCYTSGAGLTLIISIFFAVLCYFTLEFLAESGYYSRHYDYRNLFKHTFGENKVWIMNVMIVSVQFGCSLIYSHWNGRLIPLLIGTEHNTGILGNQAFWTMISACCFSIPFVCLKSIRYLEKLSVLSSFSIILLIAHALYWLIVHVKENGFDPQNQFTWFNFNSAAITSLGVNSMAYNCHLNYFPALEAMKKPTVKRAKTLAGSTMLAAFLLYNVFGLITYLDLFNIGKGSSLEYYDSSNIFTKIVLFGIIFMLVFSVPIALWAARNSINSAFFKDTEPTTLRWITIGAILAIASAGLGAISENVIVFFDIVGGIFTPLIVFLMPCVFYLKNEEGEPIWKKCIAYFISVFSIFAIGFSLYQAIVEIIHLAKA